MFIYFKEKHSLSSHMRKTQSQNSIRWSGSSLFLAWSSPGAHGFKFWCHKI